MRSIFVLLILVMIGLNGKGQSVTALPDSVLSQCCLEVTLLNGNVTTVDWVFIQYITRDGTGTKLFVEYAPNFGGIQWETQIRIQDDFDDVLARSKFIILPFTVGTTDYGIHRNWIANIEENTTTGGTWIYGRFGSPTKRKFSAVEDYETLKNLLLACRPRAIVVAENGLYTEGDTVRMGGFLIEPTTITTEGYNWQMKDTLSSVEFGLDHNTPGTSDTTVYWARRVGLVRQIVQLGRLYYYNTMTDTSTGKYSRIEHSWNLGNPFWKYQAFNPSNTNDPTTTVLFGRDQTSITVKEAGVNPYYTHSLVITPTQSSIGNVESGSGDPGNGVQMGAYGNGTDEFLFLKTRNVDATTATVGQFLQLQDATTGEAEWATIDLSGYLEIADTAAMLDPYIQGSGTINYLPKFTAARVIGTSNFFDNNTYGGIIAKPWKFGEFTTVGLPTGADRYIAEDLTTGFLTRYKSGAWENIVTSTGASANWVARFSSAGKIIGSNTFTADGNTVTLQGLNNSTNTAVFNTHSGFTQGWRIRSISSDGRTGIYAFDGAVERRILGVRANGAGGTEYLGIGQGGPLSFAGIDSPLGIQLGRVYQVSTLFGNADDGQGLIIAGTSQATGLGGVSMSQAGSAAEFDIMTQSLNGGSIPGVSRQPIRFTANAFNFNPDPGAIGVRFLPSTVYYDYYNNYISRGTNFGSTTLPEPITTIDSRTTTRGSRPFPGLTTAQRNLLAGRVTKVMLSASGTGYGTTTGATVIPVTFTGGGGTGASANAYAYSTGGGLLHIGMGSEGSGYTSAPTVTFGGAGTGATGTATITQLVDGLSIYNTDTKTPQYWEPTTSAWRDYGSYQSGSLGIQTYTPAQPLHVAGAARITGSAGTATAVMGRDANGDISNLGLSGLSIISGVLTTTGSADGNGIYTGSGTLSQHTTRALIPETGNLFFSQKFNSNADSAYFNIVNYLSGERAVNFGLTDTSSTGYSRGFFESDGAGSMNWTLETNDANGSTTVRALEGVLSLSTTAGNISLSAPVDQEIVATGLVRAKQEAYYEINSTSSPQNLSNTYSDNFINQGGTQATFTLVFPASPEDGQILKITYNNAISSLTLDGNGNTIVGTTVTTAVAGSQRIFKFYAGDSVWIRQN